MFDDENDDFNGDDSKVRLLMEKGDMGYRPGDEYPRVSPNTLRGKIWLLSMGRTLKEHEQSLRYEDAERAKYQARVFKKKIRARRKLSNMRRLEARKYNITEVSFLDPDVLPRHMKVKDFVNLYSAIAYANSKGVIFNVHLTINWRNFGYDGKEGNGSQLYNRLTHAYTSWCRDNDIDCIWIYSNESSHSVGLHTHFMTSIPEDMIEDFELYITKRMKKINKSEMLRDKDFKISVPKRKNPSIKVLLDTQWKRFMYLCKGINQYAKLEHANGLDSVLVSDLICFGYESPGDVACKRRSGLSRNIDKKERKKQGFESAMEKGYLNTDYLYSHYGYQKPVKEKSDEEICEELRILNL